jgi:predicted nucleic acid-binding Zn ribbon protein
VTTTSSPAPSAAPEATHHCIRCGATIPLADALCRTCNPARLKQPAASQAHGTVFLGIGIAIVAMALLATALVGGVGPFGASLRQAAPDGDGLVLTVAVTNDGSRAGKATCRVWDPTYLGNPPVETYIQTPEIPAGQEVVFDQRVGGLGAAERPLAVDCAR